MDDIPFRAPETLALWQWLVLGAFCSLLIIAAVVARLHARKGKSKGSLWEILTKPTSQSSASSVQYNQVVLSRQAKLHKIAIDGVEHTVFETEKGLIELHSYEQQRQQKLSDDSTNV